MGNDVQALVPLFPDHLQNPVDHIEIELINQPRVLQRRDKVGRRQKALLRIDPSGQGLHVADLLIDRPDDRLEIDLDPLLPEGRIQVFEDVLPEQRILPQLAAVIAEAGGIAALVPGAGKLCPVARGTDRDIFHMIRIDPDMNRRHFSVGQRAELMEDRVQLLLQAGAFGEHGKMIPADAAAAFIAERADQDLCEGPENLIARRKAVPGVEKLHAYEVNIQQHGQAAVAQDSVLPFLRQFKEIASVRQAGQKIVVAGFQDALLMQRPVHRPDDFSIRRCILRISAFVRIPHLRKSRSVFRTDMLPDGMHNGIGRAVLPPRAIDHLIPAALCSKLNGGIGDPGGVIRMRILVHVMIHIIDGFFTIRISQQLTKAVGQNERDNPLINKLIDGKGLTQAFQRRLFFR